MPTAEKAHQQALPGADRGHRFVAALPVYRITPGHALILFVAGPVNITHVVIADKDPAIFGSTHRALTFFQPALDQQGRNRAPSPNIGASVEGIAQNVADQALRGNLPDQPRPLDWVGWEFHVMITEPLKCLTHTPPFPELREHQLNSFRNPTIGMQNDLTQRVKRIPDRESFEQLAAARFRLLPRLESLPKNLQFDDAERSFDAQHQLVIEII